VRAIAADGACEEEEEEEGEDVLCIFLSSRMLLPAGVDDASFIAYEHAA
jgi:hypothetical protein